MNDSLTPETVIMRRSDLMTSQLSDTELVMLNLQRGTYYGMADTAQVIWSYLDAPRSIAAICTYLQTRYVVDSETCKREVLGFVHELLQDELVNIEASG